MNEPLTRPLNSIVGTCALLAIFLIGCGTGEQDMENREIPLETRILTVTDSISGVLEGEECMFGAIERTVALDDGSVLALDIARCCVYRFSPDGAFVGIVGSAGPGPGELGFPSDITVLENGTIAVSDPMKAAILLYSPDSGYVGLIDGFPMTPVRGMHPAPGGGFIGWRSSVETGEDGYITAIRVGRWVDSGEPETVYWESVQPSDMSSFSAMLKQSLYAVSITADEEGRVFVAPLSTEDYTVFCLQPDGEHYTTITLDLQQVERTEEEMRAETWQMEARMRAMGDHGMPMVWEPDPYRIMVGEMGTDSSGRLWIRRGTESVPVFDVFDPATGERLFRTELDYPGDATGWVFSVQPEGILAWSMDAESCQSIYRLELTSI